MKNFLLISLLYFIYFPVRANNLDLNWKEGNVILESEGYFSGEVFIDTKNDVLFLKKGDQIKAYPALKVKKLQLYDDELKVNRDFVSYNMRGKNGAVKKVFLEIVLTGEIPIYRKEKALSLLNYEDPYLLRTATEHEYIYYAEIEDNLVALNKFKKGIFPLLVQLSDEKVQNFKEENNLKFHLLAHQIIMIDHYNSVQDPFYKGLKSIAFSRN